MAECAASLDPWEFPWDVQVPWSEPSTQNSVEVKRRNLTADEALQALGLGAYLNP